MASYYIVGLGNPEPEYTDTRHNAGRIFIKSFARKHEFNEFLPEKKVALVSEGKLGKYNVTLVMPNTYMNNSGKGTLAFIKPKKELSNIIVLHDDIDLPLGRFKIVFNRGSGGHRGVESIRRALKTEAFIRIRIGISPKKKPNHKELLTFLTAKFKPAELTVIKKLSKKISEALETIITGGREKAMSLYN